MRTRARAPIAVALIGTLAMAHAFEPGSDHICTPSTDGQTFECRDKLTGSIMEPTTKPSKPAAIAPKQTAPEVAAETPIAAVSGSAPKPAASRPPNYLMQNPSAAEPLGETDTVSATAEQPASTRQTVRDVQPAVAEASPAQVQAPPAMPAAASHAQDNEVAAAQQQAPGTERAPAAGSTAAASLPTRDIARVMPKPAMPSPAVSRTDASGLPAANAFLALPPSHYTLVLASERNPSALDRLIRALNEQPGQLYLLKLGMPDGDWYSLCWSDFADLDAAREARASLPADAPIQSGWPRRIGLLQKELAR